MNLSADGLSPETFRPLMETFGLKVFANDSSQWTWQAFMLDSTVCAENGFPTEQDARLDAYRAMQRWFASQIHVCKQADREAKVEAKKTKAKAKAKAQMEAVRKADRKAKALHAKSLEMKAEYERGSTIAELAKHHRMSYQKAHYRLRKVGTVMRPHGIPVPSNEECEAMKAEYERGSNVSEIAGRCGLSRGAVHLRLRMAGTAMRSPGRPKGAVGNVGHHTDSA